MQGLGYTEKQKLISKNRKLKENKQVENLIKIIKHKQVENLIKIFKLYSSINTYQRQELFL